MKPHYLAAIFLLCFPLSAFASNEAPSFDCSRASQPVDRLICDSPELSNLDAIMAKLFTTALNAAGENRAVILGAQRQWNRKRAKICAMPPVLPPQADRQVLEKCMADLYSNRNEVLGDSTNLLQESLYGEFSDYGVDGDAAQAAEMSKKVEGSYRERVKIMTAEKAVEVENSFLFAPVSKDAAYIEINEYFDYGHTCSLSGIAEYKKIGGFVLQEDEDDALGMCQLTVQADRGAIKISPIGSCSKYCGARGHLGFEHYSLSSRKKISADELAKASHAYEYYRNYFDLK